MTHDDGRSRLRNPSTLRSPSTLRAYLQLVRLPNVFTAMADAAMGFLFVQGITNSRDGWTLGLLIGASSLLYASGVVFNDVFDHRLDALERPERPIPSGRVPLRVAAWLGGELMLLGVALAWLAGYVSGSFHPGVVAVLLAGCILAYDGLLKRTPVGPLAMGGCRMLNVLLGMSVATAAAWQTEHWLVAGGVGTYIVGVTWFARTEARRSSRLQLGLATAVMMLGIAMLAWFPSFLEWPAVLRLQPEGWQMLMLVLGLLIGWRCLRAVLDPIPPRVQMAVAHAILSLIVLDAVICFAVRDDVSALAILLLLAPAMYLGRWIEST